MNKIGIIKLLPVISGKIKIGTFIKYGESIEQVTKVDALTCNEYPKAHCKLMKYFVANNRGIIGELKYTDYNKVTLGTKVEVSCEKVFNKPEIGDTVNIIRLKDDLLDAYLKAGNVPKGIIVAIKGRKAEVELFGDGSIVTIKRYQYKLIDRKNWRLICNLI
jgi:hypothetical protein